jgi:hypothetical protein
MRTFTLVALIAAALLVFPALAHGKVVVRNDAEGRPITFDVRAPNVDVAWYARHMRRALHGDEIAAVTVRVVRKGRIEPLCGRGSEACYKRDREGARMIVPKGRSSFVATLLFHEYGHHVDLSYGGVQGVREMNGTAGWWQARNMDRRLENGKVAIGYSLGWRRSVGEIFAEDYARLHTKFAWQIAWIRPPNSAVLRAIRADLAAGPCGRRSCP